jgi:hypothetical protein
LRLEKKRKEEEEHKKRMAALKAKKKVGTSAATRPKFDRSKLSAGFMTNAKSAKDEVNGWALDFDNPSQTDANEKIQV